MYEENPYNLDEQLAIIYREGVEVTDGTNDDDSSNYGCTPYRA